MTTKVYLGKDITVLILQVTHFDLMIAEAVAIKDNSEWDKVEKALIESGRVQ